MARSRTHRRGRPTLLSRLSTAQLKAELERRRSMSEDIRRQRDALDAEIAELGLLNGRTAAVSASPQRAPEGSADRRGLRSGNKQSLPAVLHSLLRGKTMTVGEMADAAKKSGYKSKSKNFRMVVSLAILKNRKMFRKVARGQYTAK